MVGHTGKFDAVLKAVETVDKCLSEIVPVAKEKGYHVIVTADHGNAEQMLDEAGNTMTAHSMNEVPLILIHNAVATGLAPDVATSLADGKLGDIAPTLLHLMNIQAPKEMTGKRLI
jgi:2,3-bisphosphoglycerate-independent phosphoglycerate mutase